MGHNAPVRFHIRESSPVSPNRTPNRTIAPVREVVGVVSTREQLKSAVEALLKAGFEHSDLSVLSSHDSIEAVGEEGRPWRDALVALLGDIKYEGPLVTAGLIALAAGPVGAAIAAVVAAGVSGVAAKELLDEVTSVPDSEEFARALEAGSIIVWVAAPDALKEGKAKAILSQIGATNVHLNERTPR